MVAGPVVADEGTSAAGTWLELSIEADPEAVEAVSEILSRAASGGVSVEQPFSTEQEGQAATAIAGAPVTIRAYLPAIDMIAADAAVGVRAAPHRGAADPRRPRGGLGNGLEGALPGHAAGPTHRHQAHLARVRAQCRRCRHRPRSRHGLWHRPASHDATVPGRPGAMERRRIARRRMLDLGSGSGILAVGAALLGARPVQAIDTDPIAVESTLENAARNGVSVPACSWTSRRNWR